MNPIPVLRHFVNPVQLQVILSATRGEEGAHFRAKLDEFAERCTSMPKVYGQDGKGKDAIAYLHYFRGGNDWYITERDISAEQLQAFGVANFLGHEPELGYIGIEELIGHGVELDLYFEPTPLRDLPQN
ncbi:hypothetical protein LMG31884_47140 (plasmid) [Xanthomonas hydrangeae]|uniref:hypothetical protein n=1 Tax=Xanthomonas hydrangeae TaxID=2775159 RepID=UPI001962FF39|nr:hypothetical protein LMG31884_47140 [Xanthomonas hydrangeae]CAD7740991.1 hypothetical protein LMG31884_47140 [Xanthomonas hydrangeae]CAD7747992.1 hypothetical protein LMG31887_46670 [Xanthomonas hydrangeae]CAD7747993.1 hypothetical protein LMG31887_46670 [Xanthomonas hydrangeae]CAD7748130.1 hypothetical protein LMG31885_44820 [Xanthomonas hydrangeae]